MGIGIIQYSLRRLSYATAKVYAPSSPNFEEITLDISSYNGSYYIMAGMSGSWSDDLKGYLYALWFE